MLVAQEQRMNRNGLDIGQIARDHYEAVFRFCARRVGQDHAPDAAQETFLTAHRVLDKFEGRSELKTWLFGIAHNECRRLSRMRKLAPAPMPMEEAHGTSSPEGILVDREALRIALMKLSPEHRHVVMLHEIEGLSYDEAAEVLGVPAGTVKSRLHHAFIQLRRSLGDCPGDRS